MATAKFEFVTVGASQNNALHGFVIESVENDSCSECLGAIQKNMQIGYVEFEYRYAPAAGELVAEII